MNIASMIAQAVGGYRPPTSGGGFRNYFTGSTPAQASPPPYQPYFHSPGANPQAAYRYTNAAARLPGASVFGAPQGASAQDWLNHPTNTFGPGQLTSLLQKLGPMYSGSPTIATDAQTPSVPAAGGAPNVNIPDALDSDPVLAQIRAAAINALNQTKAADMKDRTQALIGFGDRGLAEQLLGKGYGGLGAISADPDKGFSTLSQIAHQYRDTTNQTEDALNKGNLFYGGFRGKTLNDLSYQDQRSVASATSDVQKILAGIARQDLMAEQQYQATLQAAIADAYNRYLARLPIGQTGGSSGPSSPAGAGVPGSTADPFAWMQDPSALADAFHKHGIGR